MSEADTYDYVIVGAGSAGSVLASRLTEDGRTRVLLLEAGGEDTNPWIHVPLGYGKHFTNAAINWLYQTEPEPECGGRRIMAPRGKVLGGSSSINGMVYIRGQAEDFDHWRQLGNAGWSYADVLPYFKKAEDQERGADAFHGTGGPLAVSDPRDRNPLCEAFVAAAIEAGHPRNRDFNGATQEGFGTYQCSMRNGWRCSTSVGYLRPARRRSTLAVETGALASRVLLEGRRAVGIAYSQNGRERAARARAEVILAGGAFNSPQLLQLSGIGPADLLRAHGIQVVADVPGVGADLQDHYCGRFIYRANVPVTLNDTINSPWRSVAAGLDYALRRRGFLAMGAAHAGGFLRSSPSVASPDIQTHIMLFSTEAIGQPLHPFPGFNVPVILLRPESRGDVRIRSADPAEAPAIRMGYLTAEKDRDTLLAGARAVRHIMSMPAIARYVAAEHEPGPRCTSDEDLLDHIRRRGSTVFHPTSTCRMGRDARAVVDERLRVRGFEGLRVIDASIMPALVSGNTNAATIMIAEKGADLVRADARAGGTRAAA